MEYFSLPFEADTVIRKFQDVRPDIEFGPDSEVTLEDIEDDRGQFTLKFEVSVPVSKEDAKRIFRDAFGA